MSEKNAAPCGPIVVLLPVKTLSEANAHTHWRARQKRAREHRLAAALSTARWSRTFIEWRAFGIVVTLTRIAPRSLDSDNLAGSQKHVRDGIADAMGLNDNSPLVDWRYEQRRGKPSEYAVEIVIERRT